MSATIHAAHRGHTSASNALADSLCPGRHLAQAGLPEPPSSNDAKSGSQIHAVLANQWDVGNLSLEQREMFDACREIEKRVVIDYFGEQPPAPVRVVREQADGSTRCWVKFGKNGSTYEHSGQPDVVYRSGTKALVVEYKTGANEVAESPRNMQLRDQAALLYGNLTVLDEIATVVVQPLVTHDPQVCVYSKADLERATVEMYERVIASNNPNSPRVAGETQCAFCLAKKLCVTYQKWAAQCTPPAMQVALGVPMASWTPEQRATAANALGPEDFLDELKDFLKSGLKADAAFVPGWGLKPGAKMEAITNPQACFDRFAAQGGTLDQFMGCVKVGKTRLKEELHATTKLKGKALDTAMGKLTEGIVEAGQKEPSLKRLENGEV